MKKSRDPRINASNITLRTYLSILLLCNVLLTTMLSLYTRLHEHTGHGYHESLREWLPILLPIGGYVVAASFVLLGVVLLWRRHVMDHKILILSEAARKVAEGDYSVRIPPQRKDGKMDEFEVLYADFNTMAERLSGKTILREDFLSNVSHEFKTPLSVINSTITLLQSGTLSEEESREYMERVRLASTQLSDMVGGVLQISRMENGKVIPNEEEYDLSEQLIQTILNFDPQMAEKELNLETDLEPNLRIRSDAGLLQIVWNNLLSNAIKFTPEGGSIRVQAKKTEGEIRVSVSDTGCGISEGERTHIFEKFYQADSSHSTKGNGLGLAMVKNITSLLGCTVSVESEVGKGACFTVLLPG